MFNNRALRVQMVRTDKEPTVSGTTVGHWHIEPEQISKILQDSVRTAAIVVGGMYALKTVLSTASEIAIITANAKIN